LKPREALSFCIWKGKGERGKAGKSQKGPAIPGGPGSSNVGSMATAVPQMRPLITTGAYSGRAFPQVSLRHFPNCKGQGWEVKGRVKELCLDVRRSRFTLW
jgi:hypothetical protein